MLAGELYNPLDTHLLELRQRAESACERLNDIGSKGTSNEEMSRLLNKIVDYDPFKPEGPLPGLSGQHIGTNVRIQVPFHADYGFNLRIGDDVLIKANCRFEDARHIQIGNGSVIGPNVLISGELMPRYTMPYDLKYRRGITIRIGKNVFIGPNSVIAPRVLHPPRDLDRRDQHEIVIGDGAYIAPGSVVYENIDAGVSIGPIANYEIYTPNQR